MPSKDESDTDAGQQTQTWNLERPHPPYIITLVVGKFDVVKRDAAGIPQYDYVPPGWGKWADEVFGRTPDMMAFFQEYTGQKYPWKRYSQVTVWDFHWGGMENTGATTLNMRALHKDGIRPDYSADGLVAHELAHMWFGDLITCRTWNHIWLNEGFATYFTDLWVEHHHGPDDFAYARRRSMDRYLDSVDLDAVSRKARPEKATDCGDVQGKPYVKGSSILHMLRHVIGDFAFSTGVKTYVKRARDQSVESEVLRHAMEEESGQDLSWFFEQWVYGSGVPRLAVKHAYDKDAGLLTITVEQTQPVTDVRPLFRTPVDVEISPANGETISRRFQLHSASHSWTVPLAEEPLSVTFDPGDWLVAKIERTQTREQWQEQLATGSHAIRRIRAARALAKQGVKAVAALARSATQDTFHGVRAEAAKALGVIGGKQAAEALVQVCSDKDSRVRSAALEALGSVPATWSADTLADHALNDASVYAAAAAAESLGKVRAPNAFAVLSKAVERESHRNVVRQRAMDGLRQLGDPRGAQLAYGSLAYVHGQGVQHRLRHSALDAAVALAPNAPETQEWIVKLVLDPYFRMRNWAAGHAAQLGVEAAIPRLEESAKNGLGPGVRRAAKNALKKLRGPEKETPEPK
jgi:aminopeptidase N